MRLKVDGSSQPAKDRGVELPGSYRGQFKQERSRMMSSSLQEFAVRAVAALESEDPILGRLLEGELDRQMHSLTMVASCSVTHPSVLACEGMFASNVTAEGYPGARFHAGCKYVDQFEQLAIDRAKAVFKARYANVQPHTASTANQIVTSAVLKPGDTLLGMSLTSGGHLSHGAKVNISGKFYNAVGYGLDSRVFIDFDQVQELAELHRPKLIICGATAYPRAIDWQKFRDIADRVGAFLLADITHIAGLVIAGLHPSPIDVAHFTVTCTHKQLYGPRGGLILMGKDWDAPSPTGKGTLSGLIQSGVFPFTQGAPIINKIIAKARTLDWVASDGFKLLAGRIVTLSRALAQSLMEQGIEVVSGGTDNHIVLVNVRNSFGISGIIAEKALEECNIIVNKNFIPGDQSKVSVTSGIRIGTNALAARCFGIPEMATCAGLIRKVLHAVRPLGDFEYELSAQVRQEVQEEVRLLGARLPIPGY
jgi:glycine hydroxymethyltransferase